MSTRTPEFVCKCGERLDAATYSGPGDAVPSAGDLTVCAYCAHVYTFSDGLNLSDAPPDVWNDPEIARLRAAILERKLGG